MRKLFPIKIDELEKIIRKGFEKNPRDLTFTKYEHKGQTFVVFCVPYQVNEDKIEDHLLKPLLWKREQWTNDSILNEIPFGFGKKTDKLEEILKKLVVGEVLIYIEGEQEAVSYLIPKKEKRGIDKAETEGLVLGPKIAFTESLVTNMNIIHWRLRTTDLVMEEIKIGKTLPVEVRLVYLKSVVNEVDVNTLRQRLLDIDVDQIEDAIILKQYLEDSQMNLFPQFEETELPDRFTYAISKGRLGIIAENSPTSIVAPANLFTFFESTEDLYMRWQAGSFLRLIRLLAMMFTILVTPIYVALATYQYGVIPTQLLITIGQSRAGVPFPPLIEALIIEFLLELLREAGARLPVKVGQTMGIVGGIVIGQAAVEAGMTSNILIIVVAMSALSSFTTPSYLMGTTIRLVRFPLIFLAGAFGLLGIAFGLALLVIHLLRLTSLGRPYLVPLYPLRIKDFSNVFYRLPYQFDNKNAESYQPKRLFRYSKKDASKQRDNEK